MSIKDYPTEQLLSELAARVRPNNPLYDPQELRDMLIKSESECSELRAQVEQAIERAEAAEAKRDSNKELYDAWYRKHLRKLEAVKAERDALQARIDAGVRVWGKDLGNGEWCWSYTEYHTIDTHTALLIDTQPADHIADAGKMVDDDRVGKADRRDGYAKGSCHRVNQTADTRGKYRTAVPNTRRKTPGTNSTRPSAR